MTGWTIGAAAASLLLLAGCGQDPEVEAAESASSSSVSIAPSQSSATTTTPSRTAAVRVGEEAACHLFLRGDQPPSERANELVLAFVDDPTGQSTDVEELRAVVTELESLEERAPVDWAPFLQALAQPLRDLDEAITTGVNREVNFQDYRAAGLELATRCGA